MNNNDFCQSCSMPLDSNDMRGTEKNGLPSAEYCKYCYQDGAYTNPDLTLKEMTNIVQTEMEKRNIPAPTIKKAVDVLPLLKRWKV